MSRLLELFPSFNPASDSFTDSHCHLDFAAFDADREQVMARAQAAGVQRFLVPGVSHEQWPRLAALAALYENWHVAFGLHPYFLRSDVDYTAVLRQLPRWLEASNDGNSVHKQAIAVGEIGLDATKPYPELQRWVFQQQLSIAAELELPVILHHRKTLDEMLGMVRKAGVCGGIVHAFSGSAQQAQAWVAAGFRLGVGGVVTYPRARKTRAALLQVPVAALVIETDSPDMPLCGMQGRRNEPANVALVAGKLARGLEGNWGR